MATEDVEVRFGASLAGLTPGVAKVKEEIESIRAPVDNFVSTLIGDHHLACLHSPLGFGDGPCSSGGNGALASRSSGAGARRLGPGDCNTALQCRFRSLHFNGLRGGNWRQRIGRFPPLSAKFIACKSRSALP
jgi:hypothetical protein